MAIINPFVHAIELLEQFGFFQVMLPILLVFILFFAILQKTKILGEDEDKTKPINAAFAFIAAFFVVTATDVIDTIAQIIPSASLLLVIAALLLLLMGIFNWKPEDLAGTGTNWWGRIGAIIILLIFLGMIDMTLGLNIPIIHDLSLLFVGQSSATLTISEDDLAVMMAFIVMISLFLIVGYFIFRSGGRSGN